MAATGKKHQFPLYVTKRMGVGKKKYWLIRIGGILVAFLAAGIICSILAPGSFGLFFSELIRGCFDFSDISILMDLLVLFAVLLLISISLIPAFKMKFWNIGAEGQILIGCLAAAGVCLYFQVNMKDFPNFWVIIFALLAAIGASLFWTMVPTFFKTFFNTNETLFTLMMNYVATIASSMAISLWIKNGSHSFPRLKIGIFPKIWGTTGTLVFFIALAIFAFMFVYVNFGKHGYEIAVLGESSDTARYIGINPKKVMLRTMVLCGVLSGVIGFFLVCGVNRSFNATLVGGKGFTGVLIAWLGHFDPLEVAMFSFLSAVMEQGTKTAASAVNISSTQFSAICSGVFFFIIIACEFVSSYQIRIHHKNKVKEVKP